MMADSEHHVVFSDQFCSSFSEMFLLRMNQQLCDVMLETEGGRTAAHRVVLASLSPYFKAMFTSPLIESRQDVVRLNGVDYKSLVSLVNYAYTARIVITEDNVLTLLSAASVLQFTDVKTACSSFLRQQLHPTNCLGIKMFAELHGCRDLAKAADVFTNRFFSEVCTHEEFMKLSLEDLNAILSSNHLNVDTEMDVCNAALKWVRYDEERRSVHLLDILKTVRLHLLSVEQLLEGIGKHEVVISHKECVRLLLSAVSQRTREAQMKGASSLSVAEVPEELSSRKPIEQLFAVGGWNGRDAVNTVESINSESMEWQVEPSTDQPRNGVGLAVLNDQLYAVGGHSGTQFLSTVEVYDLKAKQWKRVADLKQRRASSGVVVYKGSLYAVGGQDGSSKLKAVERYDPEEDKWYSMPNMNTRRDSPGVVVHHSTIYAIGGCHTCMFLDTVEKFNFQKSYWSSAMHMTTRRSALGVVSLGEHIYAFGGHNERGNLCSVEQYSPHTDSWVSIRDMNSPRAGVGAAVLDGKIVAVGGYDGMEQLDTVEEYNPLTNQWRFLPPLKFQRSYIGVVQTLKIV